MWISAAYAQTTGAAAGNGMSDLITGVAPLILIFVVFYFLLIRPQQNKLKEQKNMLSQIRRGDKVVTGGGVIGTVAKVVNEEQVEVDIADNVRVRIIRSTISTILSRTEPVSGAPKAIASDKSADASVPPASTGLFSRLFKR